MRASNSQQLKAGVQWTTSPWGEEGGFFKLAKPADAIICYRAYPLFYFIIMVLKRIKREVWSLETLTDSVERDDAQEN